MVCQVLGFSNGDPVSIYSALTLSRTPQPIKIPDIQLIQENIIFTPQGQYSQVYVKYLLHNKSKRDYNDIHYGFPIDYYGSKEQGWASRDYYTESIQEIGWHCDYIKQVSFTFNREAQPWLCSKDTVLKKGQSLLTNEEKAKDTNETLAETRLMQLWDSGTDYYQYSNDLCRRWYYTQFSIKRGEYAELEIQYLIANTLETPLYNNQNLSTTKCFLRYDFTPAAYWGNGKANIFNVKIDMQYIDIEHTKEYINKYKSIDLPFEMFLGLKMTPQGNDWVYQTTDFDFTLAEPFQIFFIAKKFSNHYGVDWFNRRISPDQYTIRVSGHNPSCPIENLSDMDMKTALVLLPNAQDSTFITIEFKDPTFVSNILLYNGNCKDIDTWIDNGKVDSMCVISTTIWSNQYYDSEIACEKITTEEPEDFGWLGLNSIAKVIPVNRIYLDNIPPKETSNLTKEIRMVITSTVAGKIFNNPSLSEIMLIGK